MRKALIAMAMFLIGVAGPAARCLLPSRPGGHRVHAEVGMDPAKLNDAGVHEIARNGNAAARFSDQEINGQAARLDADRARRSAGLIIRRGYIVAEFGDTLRPDPTYSVAEQHSPPSLESPSAAG